MRYLPDGVTKASINAMPDELVDFFPTSYLLERVNVADHSISIIAEADKHELDEVDRTKFFQRQVASKFYKDAFQEKENA